MDGIYRPATIRCSKDMIRGVFESDLNQQPEIFLIISDEDGF
jgi:hypothetical protein